MVRLVTFGLAAALAAGCSSGPTYPIEWVDEWCVLTHVSFGGPMPRPDIDRGGLEYVGSAPPEDAELPYPGCWIGLSGPDHFFEVTLMEGNPNCHAKILSVWKVTYFHTWADPTPKIVGVVLEHD